METTQSPARAAGGAAASPPPRLRRLITIVPALDEEAIIGETIRGLRALDDELAARGFEHLIYVVDDGSGDGTREQAREAGCDRVLIHRRNRGLGAAVRTGLASARADGADVAVKFDADLQHSPADVISLLGPILADEADVVYGSRFENIDYRMPMLRRAGNAAFTALMRWLTGWPLRDAQPGILAVHRSYLEHFHLPGDYNYTQQLLLDAFHKGMRFAHVPVRFRQRRAGRSFVSLAYPFRVLPQILMVLVGVKPQLVFVPIGAAFLTAAAGVSAWDAAAWFAGRSSELVGHGNLVLGLSLFGLQTLLFGLLADLIVRTRRR